MTFKDHFSQQSGIYAKYRPMYPPELYRFLASVTPGHDLAWDCGTGNGQAATGLAPFYDAVVATDPSEQQIKNAFAHPKVKYAVQKAEDVSLDAHSVDLITVANAIHWFDLDLFYKKANDVLKAGGVIAVWTLGKRHIGAAEDAIIDHYHDHTLNDFWRTENRLAETGYEQLPFPFKQIESPAFTVKKEFDLAGLIAYLNTWSATQKYISTQGINPTDEVFNQLKEVWGDAGEKKTVSWGLALKVGNT